jgi:2-polyprenyl-3-methyl-5-hydroxy-6-metoxy-1,4-benzoquinol methylase
LEQVEFCPVCGDSRRSEAYGGLADSVFFCAPGTWRLERCEGCRSLYLNPRPTQETIGLAYARYFTHTPAPRPTSASMGRMRRLQRALANGYRNRRYGTREEPSTAFGALAARLLPLHRALMDVELRHLPKATPGARVLDVGCGDGAFLDRAKAAGWCTVGVDVDPAAVAVARSRQIDVRCGGIDAAADQGPFDAITISHVIEHVHDPAGMLRTARAMLKPGGSLWIDTPNVDSLGHRVFGASWLGLDPPRHLVLFTPASLGHLLAAAGFVVARTVSRFEVCASVFAASSRIAAGQDPLGHVPVSASVRWRAARAAWRERLRPDLSEFITLVVVPAPAAQSRVP